MNINKKITIEIKRVFNLKLLKVEKKRKNNKYFKVNYKNYLLFVNQEIIIINK